jgi:hypothetical protein
MKHSFTGLSIILLILPALRADDRESFDAIRFKLIQEREKIKSAHVTMSARDMVKNNHMIFEYWYDTKHSRFDQILDVKNAPSRRNILCVHCPKEGYFIQHVPSDTPLFGSAATSQKMDDPKNRTFRILDTRTLGLSENVSPEAEVEKILAYPATAKVMKANTEVAGYQVYEISVAERMATKKFWFSEKQNNSLVKIEGIRAIGKAPDQVSFECELTFYPEIQTWLPHKITHKGELGGKPKHETYEIKFDSINQPLDPKLFTLEGVNLPPQTVVVTRRPHQPYDIVNDEGKITKLDLKTMQPAPPEEPRIFRAKTVLLGTGLFLMMIVAIRLIRKNRGGSASAGKTEQKPGA